MKLTNLDVSQKYNESKFYYSLKDFTSMFAYWIVQQHPYPFTDITDHIKEYGEYIKRNVEFDKLDFAELSCKEIIDINSEKKLFSIPKVAELNKPKIDIGSNIMFSSRYDTPKPEYDFIDLGALGRNISYTMVKLKIIDNY